MGIVSGIVVFFMVWWTVLFAVLPWGVTVAEEPEVGHAPSAPSRPRLGMKFLVTTAITVVIWLIVFALVESDFLSLRDWAKSL